MSTRKRPMSLLGSYIGQSCAIRHHLIFMIIIIGSIPTTTKFGSTLLFASPSLRQRCYREMDSSRRRRLSVRYRNLSLRCQRSPGVCHGLTNPLSAVSGTYPSLMPDNVGRVRVFGEIGGHLGSAFSGRNCVIRKHL